jgi:maltose/moltooligosaccharide transporter
MSMQKPRLGFWQMWNMSFGYFGIQFGWGLQMGNLSSIYEYLGAVESDLPMLWLAAPLTGLLVQPFIGAMSDRTWGLLGRRRPYFLAGAILASIALFLMPRSGTLWMAAGLLWMLDSAVNISMEPFRAFVADLLPKEQLTVGFAMQSVFIGAGAVLASKLPGWLADWGVSITTGAGHPIPATVHWAFNIGAAVFLLCVLWTVVTTREYPPEDSHDLAEKPGALNGIISAIREMPETMRRLALVQFFTWMGLFCMFIFFSVAVAHDIMGATDTASDLYKQGIRIANDCNATYNLVAFLVAIALLRIGRLVSAKRIHAFSLLVGGLGLASVSVIRTPSLLLVAFVGVGIAWASILSMPYAMIARVIPQERIGVYMGIFNLFIVLPQILVAVILSRVMAFFPHVNRLSAVVFGGGCLIVAAFLTLRVSEEQSS